MTRRTKELELRKADLRPEQMRSALPRLRKRIEELRAVDVNTVQDRCDPGIEALKQKVNSTLSDIFGPDTVEYREFGNVRLDLAPISLMYETPLYELREGIGRGIETVVSSIEAIVSLFEEKLGDETMDTSARARRAFTTLDLHPEIARAVTKLFEGGHFANAIEDGCKVLDLLVKMRSGCLNLGGTELMQTVFSPKKPLLKFSDLQTESEKSEQQGLMFLYAGAMLAFRNPRAHCLIEDDAEKALDYLAFLSLLARTLDRARKA
jgi:uncharacterized protein (TIGR02391 family)